MKGAVTIFVCAATIILADAKKSSTVCSRDSPNETLLPHERCNRFYQCLGDRLIAHRCASHLRFNIETQLCDWPERVECGNRNEDESEEILEDEPEDKIVNDNPSLAPTICAAEGSDGVLVAHEECNKFYICSSRRVVAMQCPPNLLYNPIIEQCDWPENVVCPEKRPESNDVPSEDDDDDTNKGNYDPSLAPQICAAEGSDGVLVAHEYCDQFYKCSFGIRIAMRCPKYLLFNPRTNRCDWPNNVNCVRKIISQDDTGKNDYTVNNGRQNDDPSLAEAVCATMESNGVLVAHEHCNKFYKCANGLPVALECPLNLLYNPRYKQCDWPENVNCGDRIIPDPDKGNDDDTPNEEEGNSDPSLAPKICAATESDGVLVAHEYCNKFYKCAKGLPVALECQLNLLYNPRYKQCDWPENVNCGDRIIPDPDSGNDDDTPNEEEGNDDPSLAPKICAATGSNGVLVAHEYCNQFYKCANGLPVALQCQLYLLYNPRNKQCDWPENVKCGDRIIPDPDKGNEGDTPNDEVGNSDPSLAAKICAAEGSSGVLVAHEHCNKFYKCANRLPVALECQLNLLYNPINEQCDWPLNVDCDGRIL